MAKTLDLGRRIELLPMDPHCHDITVGLYSREVGGIPQFLVHSYSHAEGAPGRVAFITKALKVMLGLRDVESSGGWLQFPCGSSHERALKRSFLDLCKLETNAALQPKPLTQFDKKANGNLTAKNLGSGVYQMVAEEGGDAKRAAALARGYAKICEMEPVEGGTNQVVFPCKTSHDELIGMMMFRAQNVRAAMREAESAASRGNLAAPSQQK